MLFECGAYLSARMRLGRASHGMNMADVCMCVAVIRLSSSLWRSSSRQQKA